MSTPNPWTVVPAIDYEAHMGPAGADQLAPLSQLFQEVYLSAQPDRLLAVGCSTGNGLEHVDPSITRRAVGVDVNLQYLGIARQRFFHLGPALELYCSELEKFRQAPGSFDLVHAALVLEYVQPEVAVRRFAEWLAPGGTCSVVVQLPGGDAPAPANRAMQIISKAMHLVDPAALTALFAAQGLAKRREKKVPVKHGKTLWLGVFGR
ncbi:MAG TPA: class I SAM-dependent methyltransferase [Anaeromyxobacteraceae bacterium]|nr:class I SAM-dependent methyltransferase [Anaeromyxobacteraceae bacterium]